MITINDINQVTRDDYKYFIDQINFDFIKTETRSIDENHDAIFLISSKSNKDLAARVFSILENEDERDAERYYIFEMPSDEERKEPTPRVRINLKTRKEVQAFFDALSEYQKAHG